jgi:hypothetical protein
MFSLDSSFLQGYVFWEFTAVTKSNSFSPIFMRVCCVSARMKPCSTMRPMVASKDKKVSVIKLEVYLAARDGFESR